MFFLIINDESNEANIMAMISNTVSTIFLIEKAFIIVNIINRLFDSIDIIKILLLILPTEIIGVRSDTIKIVVIENTL